MSTLAAVIADEAREHARVESALSDLVTRRIGGVAALKEIRALRAASRLDLTEASLVRRFRAMGGIAAKSDLRRAAQKWLAEHRDATPAQILKHFRLSELSVISRANWGDWARDQIHFSRRSRRSAA